MSYVVASLAVLGALGVFNLAFTARVMRRLSTDHTQQSTVDARAPGTTLPVGAAVKHFHASTVDGDEVSVHTLGADPLVALLLPGCEPCQKLLPRLVQRARVHPGGRDNVLAVLIASDPADVAHYADQLRGVARVVVDDDGEVCAAFDARSFPVVYLLDQDGRVTAAGAGEHAHAEIGPVGALHG